MELDNIVVAAMTNKNLKISEFTMKKEKRNFIIKVGVLYEGLLTAFIFSVLFSCLEIREMSLDSFITSLVVGIPLFLFFGITKALKTYKKYEETHVMPEINYKMGITKLIFVSLMVAILWFLK